MIEFSNLDKMPGALAKLQNEIKNPKKDRKGMHNAKYAQLDSVIDQIKEVTGKHGFSVIQLPFNDEKVFGVETMLLHESGEWIKGRYGGSMSSTNPQDYGKAITYFRRYALGALFNIAPEDDDDADSIAVTSQKGNDLATEGQRKFLYSLMGMEEYNKNKVWIETKMTKAQATRKIEELKEKK